MQLSPLDSVVKHYLPSQVSVWLWMQSVIFPEALVINTLGISVVHFELGTSSVLHNCLPSGSLHKMAEIPKEWLKSVSFFSLDLWCWFALCGFGYVVSCSPSAYEIAAFKWNSGKVCRFWYGTCLEIAGPSISHIMKQTGSCFNDSKGAKSVLKPSFLGEFLYWLRWCWT